MKTPKVTIATKIRIGSERSWEYTEWDSVGDAVDLPCGIAADDIPYLIQELINLDGYITNWRNNNNG